MAVQYRGKVLYSNCKLIDFFENKVYLTMFLKFQIYKCDFTSIRAVFRSNGYLGEIRTTCYGDSYAVDFDTEWGMSRCLTTECKSLQEAKDVLFTEFSKVGFYRTDEQMSNNWRQLHLQYHPPAQTKLFTSIYDKFLN